MTFVCAHARADDACVERTEAWHRTMGLFPATREAVLLDAGDVRIVHLRGLERCARIDVLGDASLDLTAELYSDEGVLLAQETTSSSAPGLLTCRIEGDLHLVLRVLAGRGRADVVASEGRAREVPGVAPCAFGAPGTARGVTSLPSGRPTLAEALLEAALASEQVRTRDAITLEVGPSRARATLASGPGCHVVMIAPALAGETSLRVDTEEPNGRARILAPGDRAHLVLACTESERVAIDIEAGATGRVALGLLDVPVERSDVPSGLVGGMAARFALESARARARGLTRQSIGIARVGRDPLAVPLEAGRCTLVLASGDAPLHLAITDGEGRLLANDLSGASVVRAWHCAAAGEETSAWTRAQADERARVIYAVFSSPSR